MNDVFPSPATIVNTMLWSRVKYFLKTTRNRIAEHKKINTADKNGASISKLISSFGSFAIATAGKAT